MANPQKENGFTPINHESMEKLLQFPFPATTIPLKLTLFVIRKTWGYNKKEDTISLSQFYKGVGCCKQSAVFWLSYLVQALILVKGVRPLKSGYVYSFNKNWEQWKQVVQPLRPSPTWKQTSLTPCTKTSLTPYTHNRKKKITKENSEQSSQFNPTNPYQYFLQDTKEHIVLIGKYGEWKRAKIESKEQAQQFIQRFCKTAKKLTAYSWERIEETWEYMDKQTVAGKPLTWKLDTTLKYINEDM